MTDLTEQWKKDELPEGLYYVNDGIIDYCLGGYWENYSNEEIIEVLAKVPSYDEWKEKTKSLKVLAEAYCKEKQQNKQLKELLKEYKDITAIAMLYAKSDEEYKQAKTVREQIDEVLK